jgi:antitoxin component YwqK of YwqJK toxin-antitoxin module
MVRIFIAALVLLVLASGPVSAGIIKQYYKNGNIMAELSMKGFTMQGLSKMYYESGKLMAETNYIDGRQEGLSREYYESGSVKSECNYTKDMPQGVGKEYYETGELMEDIQYADGNAQSKKVFYRNGKIKEEWDYRVTGPDDLAVVKSYNPDGSPSGEKIIKKPKPKPRKHKKNVRPSEVPAEKAGVPR